MAEPESTKDNVVFLQTAKTEATGRGQYSEDKVYPGASNNRVQMRVAYSDEMIEAISALISAQKLPSEIDTPHKFFRDAAVHRLAYWRKNLQGEEARKVDRALSVEIVERDDRQYDNLVRLIERRKNQLERAYGRRDPEYLEELIDKCQAALHGIEIKHLADEMKAVIREYERKLEDITS